MKKSISKKLSMKAVVVRTLRGDRLAEIIGGCDSTTNPTQHQGQMTTTCPAGEG